MNPSANQSDESINHIEEKKSIEEKQKHYTAEIELNGKQKEFIDDTGSPVTIMIFDERIMKQTEIQKMINKYQDVN